MKPTLSFLIPTFNDEETIETVVRKANTTGKLLASKHEIIVINDASTDSTPTILGKLEKQIPQLFVITHTINCGYGQTIKELYYSGRMEYLFSVPGDDQIDSTELSKLLPYRDTASMIIGRRMNRNDTRVRKIQSRAYNTLLRLLFHIPTDDVNSVRLVNKKLLSDIHLTSSSPFVDAELAITSLRKGYTVSEVPIRHKSRATEGATGGSLTRTILPTILDLLKFSFGTYQPE